MVTAIVSAAAALIGVLLGQVLTRDTEFRKWVRSERYKLCAEMLTAAEEARVEYTTQDVLRSQLEKIAVKESITKAVEAIPNLSPEIRAQVEVQAWDKISGSLKDTIIHKIGRDPESDLAQDVVVMYRLGHATEAVRLLFSSSTSEAARQLRNAALELRKPGGDTPEAVDDAWGPSFETYKQARRTFIEKARRDIRKGKWGSAY